MTADIIALATQYGRYGYRRITVMLQRSGWVVGVKRVHRIWRREGLKVPHKQPKRGRLWLNDGSCVRLRPEHPNHVWSYDFVEDRTHNGRKYRMLNIIDEFTRECLAIRVSRRLKAVDVIDALTDLFILRGIPACAFHGIRPSIPRASGRPFHEHPATLVRGLQGFSSFWISVSAVKGVGGAEGCPREGPACPAPRPPRGWR